MKKLTLLLMSLVLSSITYAQLVPFTVLNSGTFGTIPPAPGYEHSLRFNMNKGLGIKAYQIISKPDETLQFQSLAHNSWSTTMTLRAGGLGIGTTSPSAKLDVAGTAEVEQLTIAPTGTGTFLRMGATSTLGQRSFNFTSSGTYSGFTALSPSGIARLTFSSDTNNHWLGMKDDAGLEIFKTARTSGIGSYIHLPQADSRIVISEFGSYRINDGYKLVVANGDAVVEGDIISEGNIGVGTGNPLNKLQLGNSMSFHDGGNEVIGFGYAPGSNTDLDGSAFAAEMRLDPVAGKLSLGVSSSVSNTPNNSTFVIKNNGNIGIGTNEPNVKLSVEGHVTLGENGNYHLKTRHIDGKDLATSSVDDLFLNYNTGKGVHVGFGGQDSNLLVSGNVGIGTSNPSEKLTVNGKVLAEEVEVIVSVPPDYVFEKYYTGASTLKDDYTMPTLAEVAAYTKMYNHLPEVPSAKEIQENGMQLGEMTTLLLQKIEELTIYTIEQEGRIEILEQKIAAKK